MKILVIQGSPDEGSYSHELATAYADEARSAGHDVRMIDLATEDFDPVLRYGYRQHMEDESDPKRYQEDIAWADHLVFSFPIWWSAEPAILKGFVYLPHLRWSDLAVEEYGPGLRGDSLNQISDAWPH